jgi:hypothetical protein
MIPSPTHGSDVASDMLPTLPHIVSHYFIRAGSVSASRRVRAKNCGSPVLRHSLASEQLGNTVADHFRGVGTARPHTQEISLPIDLLQLQ